MASSARADARRAEPVFPAIRRVLCERSFFPFRPEFCCPAFGKNHGRICCTPFASLPMCRLRRPASPAVVPGESFRRRAPCPAIGPSLLGWGFARFRKHGAGWFPGCGTGDLAGGFLGYVRDSVPFVLGRFRRGSERADRRLIAWRLAGAGARVALYEQGDAAGRSAAAWVAPRCSRRSPRQHRPNC